MAIIILSIILALSLYGNYNLSKQIEFLESSLDTYDEEYTSQQTFYISVTNKIKTILENIKKIDTNGMFEADDYVGSVFKDLRDTLLTLESYSIEDASEDTK